MFKLLYVVLSLYWNLRATLRRRRARHEAPTTVPTVAPSMRATMEEVNALDPFDPFLLAVAMDHPDPSIAGRAAERMKDVGHLRRLARLKSAGREPRVIAIARVGELDPRLCVDIALADADAVIAAFAACQVKDPALAQDLFFSGHAQVRLVALVQTRDPKLAERLRHDPSPELRARAKLRILELIRKHSN